MNTDDYEGHTPAPWKVRALNRSITLLDDNLHDTSWSAEDKRLIAAAPDLLAFYLRVKEIMDMEEIEEIVRVELIWTVMQEMKE